ncbi:MAG TPA: helix-turn-helix domain-containing protein [Segeticoccus sp.]|uniref:helix-turn-helix transcriptional regulator n=1 Tax=Segeticoccus sp. TaxID=2706531 RepID=UPI002D7FF4CA|nr:helix-turn-helix domain-containing protein [Segeticoccus sp.]HET8600223.1 helix-turn-helix domain-containing protein [Segeticoccus sp.]
MPQARHTADDRPARVGASRARALEVLQDAGQPLGVQEVAELMDLHPNTARVHLDALVGAGLATRDREERDTPGRPRTVYAAAPGEAPLGQRNYRLLSEILTSLLAASLPQPGRASLEAGRAWGRYLSQRPVPFQQVDTEETVDQLLGVLSEIGFDPERDDQPDDQHDDTGQRIRLRHCPFREVAKEHRDVVCAIHLGLMQGALSEMESPLTADRLDPFVEPALCVAHLAPARDGGPAPTELPTPTARPATSSAAAARPGSSVPEAPSVPEAL